MNVGVGWVYVPEIREIREVLTWKGKPDFVYDTVIVNPDTPGTLMSIPTDETEVLTELDVFTRGGQGVRVVALDREKINWLEGHAPHLHAFQPGQG
jgi:hypothetical protein